MKDGGADFVYNLGKGLAQKGAKVYILTTALIADNYRHNENSNPQVLPVMNKWDCNGFDFGGLKIFIREICKINPDIIHLVYPSSYFGNNFQLPFFIKFAIRKPLVTTIFSFFKTGSTFFTKLGTLSLLLFSNRLVFIDDEYIQIFKINFPFLGNKTVLIPVGNNVALQKSLEYNDLNKIALRHKLSLPADKIYFSFVGQMDISKGLETLLMALRIVIDRGFDNVRLIMVGSGDIGRMEEGEGYRGKGLDYGREIFTLEKKLNLSQYIVWTSYLPAQDYNDYILSCDFCVLPFRRNTLGRSSLVTALSLGMPIITTSRLAKPLFFRNRENVLIVATDNENELAQAIIELIESPKLRNKIAKGGKELSREFSWDLIAGKTMELYFGLMKKR